MRASRYASPAALAGLTPEQLERKASWDRAALAAKGAPVRPCEIDGYRGCGYPASDCHCAPAAQKAVA